MASTFMIFFCTITFDSQIAMSSPGFRVDYAILISLIEYSTGILNIASLKLNSLSLVLILFSIISFYRQLNFPQPPKSNMGHMRAGIQCVLLLEVYLKVRGNSL